MNIHKLIYLSGIRLRNKKIFQAFEFLRQSQRWNLEQLEKHQLARLNNLLLTAYQFSPYYKAEFERIGFHPRDLKRIEDLKKLPILTKNKLLRNRDRIQIDYPEKLFYSETSGSTGKPLVFYRNAEWDAYHRASVFRGYEWHGVHPWDRNGYLWGYNFSAKMRLKTFVLDALQNRFRLFSYKDEEIDKFVQKLRHAAFLGGYSSMIYEIAKAINKDGERAPTMNLKMVKGTSEKIYDIYKKEIKKAFGIEIVSEYGAAECGIIAFGCPKGNMHINMETVIVEEENKEIVVTNLYSNSFPIIRYRLGDYIEFGTNTLCGCGMVHPILKEVTGRVGKRVYGKQNRYPSLTLYYIFKNLAMQKKVVLNYQAIQEKKGHLTINIENGLTPIERQYIMQEGRKYFQGDLDITINDQMELKSVNKKKKDFISMIDEDVT